MKKHSKQVRRRTYEISKVVSIIENIQGATEDLSNEVNGDTMQLEMTAKDFSTLLLKKSQELTKLNKLTTTCYVVVRIGEENRILCSRVLVTWGNFRQWGNFGQISVLLIPDLY